MALPSVSFAQDIQSRVLTDKIHGGSGVIDLLKNVSGGDLNKYFNETGKLLLLGVDVNEGNKQIAHVVDRVIRPLDLPPTKK